MEKVWSVSPPRRALAALTGEGESRGQSDVPNIWGVGYDTERDVIYLHEAAQNRILVMDPTTLHIDLLPEGVGTDFGGDDIAFSSDDSHIYAMTWSGSDQVLTRIDRDTGAGTVVGPMTVSIGGLTYDPTTQRLIGLGRDGASRLFSIDPATAEATLLTELGDDVTTSWEGLAAIVSSPGTVDVAQAAAPRPPVALRAVPNPLTSRTRIVFDHDRAGKVEAQVFDISGREVRRLVLGTRPVGVNTLDWDGRDEAGREVAAGTYFVRVSTPSRMSTATVSVLR